MPLLAEAVTLTLISLISPGIVTAVPRRPFPQFRMRARRVWFWLTQVRWFAVFALLFGALALWGGFVGTTTTQVLGVGILAVVLAILATREEP